ncbi:hypothetical protein BKA62DRAFT_192499 [Auriculariales sp. MPI-PUGE-AT-0066]|nr:hypothetical protein BKA62DRAFT_192499 [Auriculariales sp. MPI-PUGE-AT-0066]
MPAHRLLARDGMRRRYPPLRAPRLLRSPRQQHAQANLLLPPPAVKKVQAHRARGSPRPRRLGHHPLLRLTVRNQHHPRPAMGSLRPQRTLLMITLPPLLFHPLKTTLIRLRTLKRTQPLPRTLLRLVLTNLRLLLRHHHPRTLNPPTHLLEHLMALQRHPRPQTLRRLRHPHRRTTRPQRRPRLTVGLGQRLHLLRLVTLDLLHLLPLGLPPLRRTVGLGLPLRRRQPVNLDPLLHRRATGTNQRHLHLLTNRRRQPPHSPLRPMAVPTTPHQHLMLRPQMQTMNPQARHPRPRMTRAQHLLAPRRPLGIATQRPPRARTVETIIPQLQLGILQLREKPARPRTKSLL